jgi:acyl carrier protein
LLWFVATSTDLRLFQFDESAAVRERIWSIAAGILGIDEQSQPPQLNELNELGADSLDIAELLMELENEFG